VLQTINRGIDRAAEWTVSILFIGLVLTGGAQVFCRFVLNYPLPWSEEVQIFGHIWIVFLTIPIAYNRGSHIMMNILFERMPAPMQRAIAIAVDIMWLGSASRSPSSPRAWCASRFFSSVRRWKSP
jgi:TRAP-type transport system small permease protein